MQPSEFDRLTAPEIDGYVRAARAVREQQRNEQDGLVMALVMGIGRMIGVLR